MSEHETWPTGAAVAPGWFWYKGEGRIRTSTGCWAKKLHEDMDGARTPLVQSLDSLLRIDNVSI